MTTGVYAGSFDPITNGHLSVIVQASRAFDSIVVAVGHNSAKVGLFSDHERMTLIRESLGTLNNIRVVSFNGLLVQYCLSLKQQTKGKVSIVRGLRAVSDFESEMGIASLNSKIVSEIPTVFFPTSPEMAFVSSSAAKEMARYSGTEEALRHYVPSVVVQALHERLGPEVPPTIKVELASLDQEGQDDQEVDAEPQ